MWNIDALSEGKSEEREKDFSCQAGQYYNVLCTQWAKSHSGCDSITPETTLLPLSPFRVCLTLLAFAEAIEASILWLRVCLCVTVPMSVVIFVCLMHSSVQLTGRVRRLLHYLIHSLGEEERHREGRRASEKGHSFIVKVSWVASMIQI